MTLRSRVGVATTVVACLLALPLLAQEAKKKGATGAVASPKAGVAAPTGSPTQATTKAAEAHKGPDQIHRVPPYFAQLNLTEAQREKIYQARARHLPAIEKLQRQLDDAHARLMTESEDVLTAAQKKQLSQLRDSAKSRGAHEDADEATAKAAPEPAKAGIASPKAAPEPATTKGRRAR
jgi:Spy/CpxP family protein refolding chaperone